MVSPNQVRFWSVTNKTASGFTVILTPMNSSTTLSAGTIDLLVVG
jgi:hypothetical protein